MQGASAPGSGWSAPFRVRLPSQGGSLASQGGSALPLWEISPDQGEASLARGGSLPGPDG